MLINNYTDFLKLPHGQLMCKYIGHLASFAVPVLSNEWWGVKVGSTQPETRYTYQYNPGGLVKMGLKMALFKFVCIHP